MFLKQKLNTCKCWITCVPPGPFLWNSSCQLSSHSMLDYPNMHCSMNLLHLSKRYSTHLFKFLHSPFFLLYIMEALYLISILCLQFLFRSIYLTVDFTTNQVSVLFNCPFMACTVSVAEFWNALVWIEIHVQGNSSYFHILLIKYANVYFRLHMKRCHWGLCVYDQVSNNCCCLSICNLNHSVIFMSIVSLSWWIEDASNCGIRSLRSDTLLLCLF
jgi:hypothetical protein